jgi:hypothetical protein
MRATHGKLIEALDRVEQFLADNESAMDGVVTSAAHEQFTASRLRMTEHMTAQNEHRRSIRRGVANMRTLRHHLVQRHMRPIAILARATLPGVGELDALTIPTGNRRFAEFVAAGTGMARAARAHEASFLEAGFPDDFILQLEAATEALREAIASKGNSLGLRVKATSGLQAEARVARTNLRILDVRIRASMTDEALLGQWRTIRRVVLTATQPRVLEDTTPINPGLVSDTPLTNPAATTTVTQEVPRAA